MICAEETISLTFALPYYSDFGLALRSLASIAAQSERGCKVLVCDDSPAGLSSVETEQMRRMMGGVLPFRLLRNDRNLGMALTWNRCLDEADTELVTIVHGDDELHRDYARDITKLAREEQDASAVFCGASIISESGRPAFSFPDFYKTLITPRHDARLALTGEEGVNSLLRGNYIFCPTLCYRKARLGQLRFAPRYRMVPDLDLLTRLLLEGGTLVGIPKRRLYYYRRHSQNATQHLTKELTRFTEEYTFYGEMEQRLLALGYLQAARTARQRAVIRKDLMFCIVRDALQGNFSDCHRKATLFRELFLARCASD